MFRCSVFLYVEQISRLYRLPDIGVFLLIGSLDVLVSYLLGLSCPLSRKLSGVRNAFKFDVILFVAIAYCSKSC